MRASRVQGLASLNESVFCSSVLAMAMAVMATAKQDRAAQVASHQTRLQKIVLSWDYLRLLAQAKVSHKKRKSNDQNALRKVPDKFKGLEEYLEVFESLLLEECRAQIQRGNEEEGGSQCHMVAVTQWERVNEFHFARLAIDADSCQEFTENDLVLLSKEKILEGKLPNTYAFANVEGHEGPQALRIRMHIEKEGGQEGEKISKAAGQVLTSLASSTKAAWWILKLCNLSTILREYTALRSISTLPFAKTILSASLTKTDEADSRKEASQWNIPPSLFDHLSLNHNESQLQAIQAGLSRNPLVLIQGPPGTGKTQTILGVLSVVLHSTPVRQPLKGGEFSVQQRAEPTFGEKLGNWIKASPWLNSSVNPRDLIMPMDGDEGFFPTTGSQFRPENIGAKRKHRAHVLVCAPSNSALDEIVLRLLNSGLRDENGLTYNPSIVRVGLNAHHSVSSVTMDTLVTQRLSSVERSAISAGPRSSAGMERDRIRIAILDEAAIVCSTLSFSGSGVFMRMNRGFDVVVIDEAAQAVGDPLQLPATVLSTQAVAHGYGMSMFKRFQKAGYPVQMLKTQYRMHPQIREFPSKEFYEAALADGPDVETVTKRPWHEHRCFGPYTFFDINGEESQPPGSGSWVNKDEVEFVLVLYRHMVATYPELKGGPLVAVISPYKLQVKLLRQRFTEVLGKETARLVDINTIDGFQGREKDVAIFSCVRATKGKSIGFVSDFRRMNVGLTRARASMLVVGCADALKIDKHWKNLVMSSKERCRYFKVTKPYHALFNDQSLAAMKKMAEKFEEEEAQRKLAEVEAPVVKDSGVEDSDMDELLDDDADEEVEEVVENHGDVDEDVDEI